MKHIIPFILLFMLMSSAWAQDSTDWITSSEHPHVQIKLDLVTTQADQQQLQALLKVRLESPWKTYWRAPGEGGIPPTAEWQTKSNISRVQWQWPAPQRYQVQGIETVGYQGTVAFPLTLAIENWQQPARLQGVVTMSSCTNICVLTDFPVDISFNPAQLAASEQRVFELQKALSQVPRLDHPAVVLERAEWSASQQQLQLELTHPQGWQRPDVLVDSLATELADMTVAPPRLDIDGQRLLATFNISHWLGAAEVASYPIQITVLDEALAAELATTAQAVTQVTHAPAVSSSLGLMFAFALLGGLILNIMPCVLPVLGMKLQSVLLIPRERGLIRRQFLASALGIVLSFWLLALFIWGLKTSGSALGWGIQFQSPWFIGFMVLVTGLFTFNLAGLFEFRLPSSWQTWAAQRGDNSYLGHVVQGMFATLLATPCSAPFLGTAVSFAMAASNLQLWFIFTGLGLGMASPWLLVAALPSLAKLLPKPGRWMQITKVIFSLMLAATTLWLFTLLNNHLSAAMVWLLALSWLVVAALLVIRTYGKQGLLIAVASSLLVVAAVAVTASLTSAKWASGPRPDHAWVGLNETEISRAVAQGQVVFVDITADWCITCKANKIGVLLQQPVYQLLQDPQVVTMQGDWSQANDQVTQYLRKYQRYGVPFNRVYGPNAPAGIDLPVILTAEAVSAAIDQAAGRE